MRWAGFNLYKHKQTVVYLASWLAGWLSLASCAAARIAVSLYQIWNKWMMPCFELSLSLSLRERNYILWVCGNWMGRMYRTLNAPLMNRLGIIWNSNRYGSTKRAHLIRNPSDIANWLAKALRFLSAGKRERKAKQKYRTRSCVLRFVDGKRRTNEGKEDDSVEKMICLAAASIARQQINCWIHVCCPRANTRSLLS